MKLLKIVLVTLCLDAVFYETTHARGQADENKNITYSKENKTVIELNKDITVNTDLNLDKTLAQLNGTEASYIPKVRKVTPVDNDSLERKLRKELKVSHNSTKSNSTSTIETPHVSEILADGGVVNVKLPNTNATNSIKEVSKDDNITKVITMHTNGNNETGTPTNSTSNKEIFEKDKNSSTTTITARPSISTITAATATPLISTTSTKNLFTLNSTSTIATFSASSNSTTTAATTTTSSTTTTTTTTTSTTTTTTTPKPKKPTVTYSLPDFPDLEKDNPELSNLLQSSASTTNKLSISDGPYAQPSQEFNSNSFHHGRDFILPVVSTIFIIPLVIGILITSYRRFRDCWSTRHYRRMDFLVDGMYND